jgi:hypothetical protein
LIRAVAAWAAIGCAACQSGTYVVVAVDPGDLMVPTDVRFLHIIATNPDDGRGTPLYASQEVTLCPGEAGCVAPPVTVSFSPGPRQPDARVRVQVDAFDASGTAISSDATVFHFTSGRRQLVDFVLRRACLHSNCAVEDRACGAQGGCVALTPLAGTAPPEFALPPPSPDARPQRLFVQAGQVDTGPGGVQLDPARETLPGDRIVAAIYGGVGDPTLPGAWTPLGSFGSLGGGAAVLARVAGQEEGANLAA